MASIIIKCPVCKGELQISASEGIEERKAACNHCGYQSQIKGYLPKYSIKVEGRSYQLHFGKQWIGREKPGNDAEIQIPEEKLYMSKKHAIIDVCCKTTGVVCTFEEHGLNPTKKGGIELIKDDIIYLSVNDCLTLGSKELYLADEFGDE